MVAGPRFVVAGPRFVVAGPFLVVPCFASAAWQLGWRHRLSVEYVLRREHTDDRQSITQQAVSLGYDVRL